MHCRLDAFTALRDELTDLETTDGLVRAAVAVAMHELDHDEADPLIVATQIDDLADQVRARVVGDNPRALIAHAHHVLFEEARFRGNLGDYDNAHLEVVYFDEKGLTETKTYEGAVSVLLSVRGPAGGARRQPARLSSAAAPIRFRRARGRAPDPRRRNERLRLRVSVWVGHSRRRPASAGQLGAERTSDPDH